MDTYAIFTSTTTCRRARAINPLTHVDLTPSLMLLEWSDAVSHFQIFFFNFWLCWIFVAMSRGYSSLQCMGFSLRWLLLLQSVGPRHTGSVGCGLQALEHKLSRGGARAWLPCAMWNLPRSGIGLVSPAGRFLTTGPPAKSHTSRFIFHVFQFYLHCVHPNCKP